jgi:hypothetical protein
MPYSPYVVDAVDHAGCRTVYNNLAPFGPFSIPGGLLHFLWSSTANTILACHSVDGGQTWTVLDPLNSPAAPTYSNPGYIDVLANTVVLISSHGVSSVILNVFDLTTLTWQAPFSGTNPPTDVQTSKLCGFFRRSDGTRVLLYTSTAFDLGVHTAHAVVLSAGNVWGATFVITSNLPGGFPTGEAVAVLDATDTLHVFIEFNAFPWTRFYQAILSTNALGSFASLTNNALRSYFGVPVVVGANLIVPTTQETGGTPGSVWVGTPLAAPVWTESGDIFPNANAAGLTFSPICAPPFCSYDGTNLVCVKILDGPGVVSANIISISQASDPTNPLAAWSDAIVWQGLPADPIYEQLVWSPQIGNTGIISVNCLGGQINYVFLSPPPPPPVVRIVSGSPGGGGAPPKRCCSPLLAESVPWKRSKRARELDAPPPGSKHVAAAASLPAPLTNVQTQIVQYQVPNGFRFRLKGLLLGCNCPGWTPGDGNAVFSVSLNKPVGALNAQGAPVRGLDNVTVPLGSFAAGPWPIPEDERSVFESRDIVRVLVSSNPLVIFPGLPNVFTAMLVGYTWPLSSELASAML